MTSESPLWRRLVRGVVPSSWRQGLRTRLHPVLYPSSFHPYPYHLFSRYRQTRTVLSWLAYEAGFHAWRFALGRGRRLERPIFMIGSARSGTTVSVRLFARHPDVSNLSEAPEIWDPWHYQDREADHYWSTERVTAKDARRLHARFAYHRWYEGKERFINKYPRSSLRIDYIRTVFPDAVFVHVIRDGRAVAASMLQRMRRQLRFQGVPMPFEHPPSWRELMRENKLEQVALQWRAIVGHILERRSSLEAHYCEYKYESLCEDPRGVLGEVFRFAGLRVDDEVLELLPARLESQNYKWRQEFTAEQIEMVNRIQGPLLVELGYPL